MIHRRTNKVVKDTSNSRYVTVFVGLPGIRYLDYHRLKFCLIHGWLPQRVDHADRDSSNNTGSNLRAATHRQNMQNVQRKPRSYPRGVYKLPSGRFKAQVTEAGKNIHLGTFDTAEEAGAAASSRRALTHGEFYVAA